MKQHSLCWDCAKSACKGCSWSESFVPVDGWTAEETKNGYRVEECPEFVRDSYECGLYRTFEEYKKALKNRRVRVKAI